MRESLAIAHEFPGLGDPWSLPIDQWDTAVLAIVEHRRSESEAMK